MPFKTGDPKPASSGRKPAVSNHVTRDIREMLRESLELAGGVRYLVAQSRANPGPYMALIGKIIPQQIDATIRRELPQMTREDLLELLESMRTAAELRAPKAKVIEHQAEAPSVEPAKKSE